jgi:hypothetical protein
MIKSIALSIRSKAMSKTRKYPEWWIKTDKDLYRYKRCEIAIKRANQEIEELEDRIEEGRHITPGWYGEAVEDDNYSGRAIYSGPSRGGLIGQIQTREQEEERIILRLAECRDKVKQLRAFRDIIEAAIDLEFAGQFDKRRFIELYWWSGWPKGTAKKLVMGELQFLTHKTFYDWRTDIIRKMAKVLGHLPTNH